MGHTLDSENYGRARILQIELKLINACLDGNFRLKDIIEAKEHIGAAQVQVALMLSKPGGDKA